MNKIREMAMHFYIPRRNPRNEENFVQNDNKERNDADTFFWSGNNSVKTPKIFQKFKKKEKMTERF